MDNSIYQIHVNHYPVDSIHVVFFANTYPLDDNVLSTVDSAIQLSNKQGLVFAIKAYPGQAATGYMQNLICCTRNLINL